MACVLPKTENQVCTCLVCQPLLSPDWNLPIFRQHRQRALHQPGGSARLLGITTVVPWRAIWPNAATYCSAIFQRGGTVAALLFQCVRHAGNGFGIGLQAFATLPNSAAKFNRPILWRMTFWLKLLMGLLPVCFCAVLMKIRPSIKTATFGKAPTVRSSLNFTLDKIRPRKSPHVFVLHAACFI